MNIVDRTTFRISALKKVLRILKIKKISGIDSGRHNFPLFAAARELALPSYALQHGHFTKYHVGWLGVEGFRGETAPADLLIVWNTYWRDELVRLGSYYDLSRIAVGIPMSFSTGTSLARRDSSEWSVTVLIPYEGTGPQKEVAAYIRGLITMPKVRVVFKLRPDVPEETQLSDYGLTDIISPQFAAVKNVSDILPEVDLVLGVYSTYLYDMVAYEIPVGILQLGWDYGEGMIVNGLADPVDTRVSPGAEIQRLMNTSRQTLLERKKKLLGDGGRSLEDVLAGYLLDA